VKAYEVYQKIDPAIVREMFTTFREQEREVYKSALATLAQSRKLRPVFIQKKPVDQQLAWMHKTLAVRANDPVGEHLFQVWFMHFHKPMLVDFCDGMGIEHNGEGSVEGSLPETVDGEKLEATANALFEKYDPRIVSLYLCIFNLQKPGGWPELARLLESDSRLRLRDEPEPPQAASPNPDQQPDPDPQPDPDLQPDPDAPAA